ncbi:MAG TPA: hypothetical protein VKA08_11170 [Balneolales bacterium]|nr:hypothetical protein [Balneolales bacterium]
MNDIFDDIESNATMLVSGSFFSESNDELIATPSESYSFFEEHEYKSVANLNTWCVQGSLDEKKYQLQHFNVFINKRKEYLDTLEGLDNWISGESEAPNRKAIDDSKFILDSFKNWLSARFEIPIPKIIMGPIPTGGITLELRPDKFNGMFISIMNDEEIEIDVMIDDTFYSVDKESTHIKPYLLEVYEHLVDE